MENQDKNAEKKDDNNDAVSQTENETVETAEEPRTLSSHELMELQSFHDSEKLRKMVDDNFALNGQLLESKKRLLETKIVINSKDIKILSLELAKVTELHNAKRRQHSNFIDDLKVKYGIKGKWGFDPTTGEIRED